ncbi:MAG: hypothetical protein WCA37_00540 [Terracidiphilus sp.]
MKLHATVLSGLLLLAPSLKAPAQPATPAHSPAQSAAAHPAQPALPPPSSLLQPSLTKVTDTLSSLNFEKWHRGTIREEASSNVTSIEHDLQENMPPLMKSADAAPQSVSVAIPLAAHMNALYDVLLRVVEASRVSGPADQVSALEQALTDMGKARRAFEDRMQQTATAQEKEISTLRSSVTAQAAARPQSIPVPMVLPCGAFAPRHVVRKKSAPAATAKPGTTTQPAAPQTSKPAGTTTQQKKNP